MTVRPFVVTIAIPLLVLMLCAEASAVPSVDIVSPQSGSVLTSSEVTVTGTARGSDGAWYQAGTNNFSAGARESMVIKDGLLQLPRTVEDDFNDNSFDTTIWVSDDVNGIVTREEGQQLHQYGTHRGSSYWSAGARFSSLAVVGDSVEATLKAITGTGTGWGTMVGMAQDSLNSIFIGVNYDPGMWGSDKAYIYYTGGRNGVQNKGTIMEYDGISHQFKVMKNGGITELYVDGDVVKTIPYTLTNPILRCGSPARWPGDTVDVVYDDIRGAFIGQGTYTSPIYDTRAVDPLLRRVDWNGSVPSGTGMRVELRSSGSSDMASPTEWASVTSGQTVDLPATGRYLQCRVTMTSSLGFDTPALKDMTVAYHKPVKKVEVSLDQSLWVPATGTVSWYAPLTLAEGTSVFYARVTDAAGDTSVASISIDVDLTAPTGTVLINDGAEMTTMRDVSLSLTATDRYGVVEMRASGSPGFEGAVWVPYSTSKAWTLSEGDGPKHVYVMFKDANGWVSKVMNDSITLDMTAPTGSVSIDDGAAYTTSREVTLSLDAQDAVGVADMRVWEGSDAGAGPWEPFAGTRGFQLSSGDGSKAVHAEFRDRAGHVSTATSDTIVLDTTPPVAHVIIDDNATYTNSTGVILGVAFEDANDVEAMQFGEDALLAGASWNPPVASRPIALSEGDGPKTVYTRARDAAGNVGAIAWDGITLDTTAPLVQMGAMAPKSPVPSFNVTWSGSDGTSGLAGYDVQYRDGEGPWTDWFKGTDIAQAVFMGSDGHNYSFRARASDVARNLGAWSAAVSARVLVPVVSVAVDEPRDGATVEGKLVLRGTASHTDAEVGVRNVSVSVDGGAWREASGTTSWAFTLDTEALRNGPHVVRVMAHDGQRDSQEVALSLDVDNPEPTAPLFGWLLVIAIIIAVAVVITLLVWRRSRKP